MKRAALLTLALLATPLASSAADAPVAIRGGWVHTISGGIIEGGTVVLANGRIAAVGKDVAIPPGATVVDASGQHVYPGLIDGLTTLGLTEVGQGAPGTVDTTETGDVNPHAQAWVAVHAHSELIPVARANGITTALTAPAGGLISGQSALIRLAGTTQDALTVKTPVAMHVVFPSGRPAFDFATFFQDQPEKTFEERQKERKQNQEKALKRLAGLLAEAKAYGEALQAAKAAGTPVEPDLPMEALAPAARGELPVVMRADAEDDIRTAVAFAGENGLELIVAGGIEAWRCAELLKQKDVAVLLNVDRLPRRESDPYDAAYTNAARLHAAGVRFAIVSDDASQSRNLPYEAAMASAFGLPADAALRAITLSPAEIFGVADRMGSLEVGKAANVFVATRDALDHRAVVTHVFIDGQEQSLETRHTRLYEEFRKRP